MKRFFKPPALPLAGFLVLLAGCATTGSAEPPFQPVVPRVDLDRFSGSWYVISFLPTFIEKNGTNGIETYTFDDEGKVFVEYIFYNHSPQGKRKYTTQKGWIMPDGSNAVWKVRPLWPLKLPYLIIDLAEDYRYTVVGTNNYKYVWIMAREPFLSDEDYRGILQRLESRGYPVEEIKMMPQEWD